MGKEKCPLCWVKAHAGNPGNPDSDQPLRGKLERYIKRRRLGQVAEELAEKDAVSDALWDLRVTILQALKEIGEITQETTGPEVQDSIDNLIQRLVFLV